MRYPTPSVSWESTDGMEWDAPVLDPMPYVLGYYVSYLVPLLVAAADNERHGHGLIKPEKFSKAIYLTCLYICLSICLPIIARFKDSKTGMYVQQALLADVM